jgi:hypothetical protein
MLAVSTIARVAAEVRLQLVPGLAVTDRLTFERLRTGVRIRGTGPELFTVARGHPGLNLVTYASTEFDFALGEAWIWLNREAWPEFVAGNVPRSIATIAHELGHVALHAGEVGDLETTDAEADHDRKMDREAWTFAAHLLIPDAALKRLAVSPSTATSEFLAKRFGVSTMMAAKRLEEWSGA